MDPTEEIVKLVRAAQADATNAATLAGDLKTAIERQAQDLAVERRAREIAGQSLSDSALAYVVGKPDGLAQRADAGLFVEIGQRGEEIRWSTGGETGVRLCGDGRGLLDGPTLTDWQGELKRAVSAHSVAVALLGKRDPETMGRGQVVADLVARAPVQVRSNLLTTLAGQGGELIPTIYAAQVETPLTIGSVVDAWIPTEQAPIVGGSFVVPQFTGLIWGTTEGAAAVDNPAAAGRSPVPTTSRTITPVGYRWAVQWDRYAAMDSIAAASGGLDTLLSESAAATISHAMINGSTALDLDSGYPTWNPGSIFAGSNPNSSPLAGENGLRARAVALGSTLDLNATQTWAGITSLAQKKLHRASMAQMGVNGSLMILVGPEVAIQLGKLDQFATMDKIGPAAFAAMGLTQNAAMPGLVGSFNGVPVVVDPMMTCDLASTGRYTGSGTTAGLLIVDRRGFRTYEKMGYTVERVVDALNNQTYIIVRKRRATSQLYATKAAVAYGFNLTPLA